MKQYIITLLITLATTALYAQPCPCSPALDFTIKKIEANYPGMKDKVTATTQAAYQALADSLKTASTRPENQFRQPCAAILTAYLRFFKDGHLGLNIANNPASENKDSIRALYAKSPTVTYSAQDFQTYLSTNSKKLKPLEGIWQNEAGNYKIGIRYQDNKYTGFILKADSIYWLPGQIKMEIIPSGKSYTSNFYMRDHTLQTYPVNIDDINSGVFDIQNIGKWLKLDATGKIVYKDYYPNYGIVSFKKLNNKTNLLTIRSFSETYRKLIDSIITANDKAIRGAENLIIDVRGNGGGSDISYYPLKKYLFTHPYTTIGAEILCTNDNIDKFRGLITNPVFTPQEQENFRKRVKGMEEHLNQFWSSSPMYNNSDTLPVLATPKRIAIIIDSLCGSTTEQFLLDPVLNSKKATIFGTHSGGVLDYANNYFFNIPGTDFRVNYPTSRSRRIDIGKGIDNVGIQPHIKLDSSVKDWVKHAQQYLEKL
jgi:hypothetical protein